MYGSGLLFEEALNSGQDVRAPGICLFIYMARTVWRAGLFMYCLRAGMVAVFAILFKKAGGGFTIGV